MVFDKVFLYYIFYYFCTLIIKIKNQKTNEHYPLEN